MRSLLPILTTVLLLLLSEQVLASSLRHRSVATSESSLSRVLEGGYGENTPKPDKPIGGGGGNGGEADKGGSEGQEGEGQEGEGKEGEGKDDNQEEDDHDGIESEDHSEGFGNMKRPLCRHAKTWTKLKTENKEGIDDKRVALLRKLEGSEAEKKPESEGERPEGERPESERFHYDDRSGNKSHVLFSAFQPPNAWHVAFTSNTTDVHDYLFPVFPAVETSVQGEQIIF